MFRAGHPLNSKAKLGIVGLVALFVGPRGIISDGFSPRAELSKQLRRVVRPAFASVTWTLPLAASCASSLKLGPFLPS